MLQSMTGYGRGESFLYDRRFTVEIKSVNHRYNDLSIKLPRALNMFEDAVRKVITREVSRGKTDVYIGMETYSKEDIRINLNIPLADAYADQIKALIARYGLYPKELQVSSLLAYPDIFVIEKNPDNEKAQAEIWEGLEAALMYALLSFLNMRLREGKALYNDILEKKAYIEGLAGRVKARAPLVAAEYGDKLKQRLADAMAAPMIDETRLLTEIALMADRACVDEELTRLESHLSQLGAILDSREPSGRKLDFLVQEMNREVNTIASKSNDLEITKLAVELKSEVEKIREQVQNVE